MNASPVVVIGGGGHASVLVGVLKLLDAKILGYTALDPSQDLGLAYLGDDKTFLSSFKPESVCLVNGLGSVSVNGNRTRGLVYNQYKKLGFTFLTLIHPSAIIANEVHLGEGAQLMAGSILQSKSSIGNNTIVNTGAKIDHHSILGDHVHVAPGATVCGAVKVGHYSLLGAGSCIIQNVAIEDCLLVRAGTVVTN